MYWRAQQFLEILRDEGAKHAFRRVIDFLSWRSNVLRRDLLIKVTQIRHGDSIERFVVGNKMILDTKGPGIHRELILDGSREYESTFEFQNFLKDWSEKYDSTITVFDIGANIGYFALLEAKVLENQGQIFAFEPSPKNVDRLETNISLNDYTSIEIIQSGVGEKLGTTELNIRESSNLNKIVEVETQSPKNTISIDIIDLDTFVKKRSIPEKSPIILRIDVEGAEGFVFRGMTELLKSDRPVAIMLDMHLNQKLPDGHAEEIINALSNSGFNLRYASFDGGDTVDKDVQLEDILNGKGSTHLLATRV